MGVGFAWMEEEPGGVEAHTWGATNTEKIQRYLNESDIELVALKEKVYDYYVARYDEFSELIGHLQRELIKKAVEFWKINQAKKAHLRAFFMMENFQKRW